MRLYFFQQAALREPLDGSVARIEAVQAGEVRLDLTRHLRVQADHGELREPVAFADIVIGLVVPGRDLERARAEVALDRGVGDRPGWVWARAGA